MELSQPPQLLEYYYYFAINNNNANNNANNMVVDELFDALARAPYRHFSEADKRSGSNNNNNNNNNGDGLPSQVEGGWGTGRDVEDSLQCACMMCVYVYVCV